MQVIKTGSLKHCPFCGSKAELRKSPHPLNETYNRYQVICPECQAAGKVFGDKPAGFTTEEETAGKAAEAWNRRTGLDKNSISDDVMEIRIQMERVTAMTDELQQGYFGKPNPEACILQVLYERGQILSNIAFDYAYKAKQLIEELDKKLKTEGEQEQSRDKLSRPVWQQTKRKDF